MVHSVYLACLDYSSYVDSFIHSFNHLYIYVLKVYLTEHRLSGMCFATKIINRRKIKAKDDKIVLREIGILRELHGQ